MTVQLRPSDLARLRALARAHDHLVLVPATECLRELHPFDVELVGDAIVVVFNDGREGWLDHVLHLVEGHDHVWRWRQDVPAFDKLRVPDGLLLRRSMGFAIEKLILDPATIEDIRQSCAPGDPPRGTPRWLIGMSWEARWRRERMQAAVDEALVVPDHR